MSRPSSTVYTVMMASPSDVQRERDAFVQTVNIVNANLTDSYPNRILQPYRWEDNVPRRLGPPGQVQINQTIVDNADLVIAVFWSRLGASTAVACSGTIEEIERSLKAGKEVVVYFCNAPSPPGATQVDRDKVENYRRELYSQGLIDTYDNVDDFRFKLSLRLTIFFLSR